HGHRPPDGILADPGVGHYGRRCGQPARPVPIPGALAANRSPNTVSSLDGPRGLSCCDSPCCTVWLPPANWRCSPMPAGCDWQTGGPAHGLTEADDGKKEPQPTAQPQGLMIKSRTTEHP